MKKQMRLIAVVTAMALVLPVSGDTVGCRNQLQTVQEFSNYTGKELYVEFADGESKVYIYDSQEAMTSAAQAFQEMESVAFVQPNYTYTMAVTSITDADYAEQWALHNDGTFSIEDEYDDFPIYDDPFDDPRNGDRFPQRPGGMVPGKNGGYTRHSVLSTSIMGELSFTSAEKMEEEEGTITLAQGYAAYKTTAAAVTAISGIDINMEKAWEAYNGGKREVIVAVIDTGIDYTHEDLSDVIWTNTDEISGDGIDNDGNGYIDDVYGWNFYNGSNQVYAGSEDNHGTHGAGTIAANRNSIGVAGIAGNSTVKVMSLKALGGSEGSGTTESIIEAIKYAEANGATICNLSFGTSYNDSALKAAIEESNMLFIAAAGNGNSWTGTGQNADQNPVYPAAYDLDNIIAVANLQCDGTLHSSSNYGVQTVDLAAPGSNILSTTSENGYSYMTGTSMAAPMVTGAAALLYSQYEDITLSQVKDVILASVSPLDSLSKVVKTGGMLDAYAALTYDYTAFKAVTWGNESASENTIDATVPVITAEKKIVNNKTYLVVTVTDNGDNLKAARYLVGTYQAEDFASGTYGRKVSLNTEGSVTYRIVQGGTFTFYAVDDAGNETIKTITITVK